MAAIPAWLPHRLDEIAAELGFSELRLDLGQRGASNWLRAVGASVPRLSFRAEIRSGRVGHAAAEKWIEACSDEGSNRVLIVPALGREVAQRLREARCSFLDDTGLCFLVTPDGRFRVDLRTARGSSGHASGSTGLRGNARQRVLFALLANPENRRRTVRELADRCGVGRQTVATVLESLRYEELLVRVDRTESALTVGRERELVDLFAAGWREGLRRSVVAARLESGRSPEDDERSIQDLALTRSLRIGLGGTAGAQHVREFYRGRTTTVHIDGSWKPSWNQELRMAPSPNGKLWVLSTLGADDLVETHDEQTWMAHPLLLYVEMLQSGDARAVEFAHTLLPTVLASLNDPQEAAS